MGTQIEPTSQLARAPRITLSSREAREYRLGAALLALAQHARADGLAWEISDQLASELPNGIATRGGLLVPDTIEVAGRSTFQRAGLDAATATKGQELKFTEPGPIIDVLRKKSICLRLGATELEGLRGDLGFPRQTAPSSPTWAGQNPGADISNSDPTFDRTVAMSPKTIIGGTSFSRQLLIQSQYSFGIDLVVRRDIALNHAVAIDVAGINGSGTGNQPTGILNTSGIGIVAAGANGAQPTWGNITALELTVSAANADTDPSVMAYATTPQIRNTLRTKDRTASTTGWFIMQDDGDINDYPVAVSNGVPSNLTKGTSVGICHAIVFGLWPELMIGRWGAFELLADPYTYKKQALIEVASYELCDIAVRHAVSFAAMVDALQ